MTDLLAAALAWHNAGCAVIPVRPDGTKAPAVPWRDHQHTRPTPEQLHTWFTSGTFDGLGIITGAVSGGLEMLELEGRAVQAGAIATLDPAEWAESLRSIRYWADCGITRAERKTTTKETP